MSRARRTDVVRRGPGFSQRSAMSLLQGLEEGGRTRTRRSNTNAVGLRCQRNTQQGNGGWGRSCVQDRPAIRTARSRDLLERPIAQAARGRRRRRRSNHRPTLEGTGQRGAEWAILATAVGNAPARSSSGHRRTAALELTAMRRSSASLLRTFLGAGPGMPRARASALAETEDGQ
jgi:hypothetical protein